MRRIFLLANLCLAFGLTAPRILFAESGLIFDQAQGTLTGQLNVTSNIAAAGSVTASSATLTNAAGAGLKVSSSAYLAVSGGNVGIGTDNPSYKFDIGGFVSADQTLRLASASSYNTTIRLMEAGDENGVSLKYDGTNNRFGIFGHNASSTGVEYFTVLRDTGYVGIGTTAPARNLQITNGYLRVGKDGEDYAELQGGAGVGAALKIRYGNSPYNQTLLSGNNDSYLNATTGNVGIGTLSPGAKLDVNGDIKMSGNATVRTIWNSGYGGAIQLLRSDADSTRWARLGIVNDAGAWVDGIHVKSDGSVGIGTTAPLAKLDVFAGSTARIMVSATGADHPTLTFADSNGNAQYGTIKAYDLTLNNGSVDLVKVTSAGNVGIGTTGPGAKLEVAGNIAANGGSTTEISLYNAGSIRGKLSMTGNEGDLSLYRSNAAKTIYLSAYYDSYFTGGNVGIGTTSPSAPLDVVSSAAAWATRGIKLLGPNMVAGSNNSLMVSVGQADSVRNMGQMYFYYVGNGSASNRLSFGLHSVDDVLSILGTGNVGIGTTSPGARLQVAGDIIGSAQVFRAYMTASFSKAAGTWEIVPFNATLFNTLQGTFDATQRRFTASRAGYYRISVTGYSSTGGTGAERYAIGVHKTEGLEGFTGGNYSASDTPLAGLSSMIIYLNGTTDYVEIWAFSAIAATWPGGSSGGHVMFWYMDYLGT